jgi:hypothetical protein
MVGGYFRVLQLLPPLQLVAMISGFQAVPYFPYFFYSSPNIPYKSFKILKKKAQLFG